MCGGSVAPVGGGSGGCGSSGGGGPVASTPVGLTPGVPAIGAQPVGGGLGAATPIGGGAIPQSAAGAAGSLMLDADTAPSDATRIAMKMLSDLDVSGDGVISAIDVKGALASSPKTAFLAAAALSLSRQATLNPGQLAAFVDKFRGPDGNVNGAKFQSVLMQRATMIMESQFGSNAVPG